MQLCQHDSKRREDQTSAKMEEEVIEKSSAGSRTLAHSKK